MTPANAVPQPDWAKGRPRAFHLSQGPALASRPTGHRLRPPVHARSRCIEHRESTAPPVRPGRPRRRARLGAATASWSSTTTWARAGQSAEGRPGFQRLLAEVALDHVGLILGLEMSRLARSCKDWHQLLELCGRLPRRCLADHDGALRPDRLQRPAAAGAEELHEIRHGELHIALRSPRR